MNIFAWLKSRIKRRASIDDYTGGTSEMNLLARLKSATSSTYRANWLFRRGMMRAKLHKWWAALDDYTVVIDMADAPENVRAMALYNRALVYRALDNESDAVEDLNRVLRMAGVAERIKAEARRKLVRMERASDRLNS